MFQLLESQSQLSAIGVQADEFVYPYGAFTRGIAKLVEDRTTYAGAYTCEPGVHSSVSRPGALPRTLITNDVARDTLINGIVHDLEQRRTR
jgi:hypothetical protein